MHHCHGPAPEGIARLNALTGNGILSDDQVIRAVGRTPADVLFRLAEVTTRGPDDPLPAGRTVAGQDGTERAAVRLRWSRPNARTWRDSAVSVPPPDHLPDDDLPATCVAQTDPLDAPPVLFGHYWHSGAPALRAENALCLDHSAGKHGTLVSYHLSGAGEP